MCLQKKNFAFTISFLFMIVSCLSDSSNYKAKKIVKKELSYIENSLLPSKPDPIWRYAGSIYFLEELTGIESESPANFSGKYRPTHHDFQRWSTWYEQNKQRLTWISAGGRVGIIKKEGIEKEIQIIQYQPWETY